MIYYGHTRENPATKERFGLKEAKEVKAPEGILMF